MLPTPWRDNPHEIVEYDEYFEIQGNKVVAKDGATLPEDQIKLYIKTQIAPNSIVTNSFIMMNL